ncbi:MAG: hypothetical protein ACP5T2_06390, partial [Thermoprotei archaeon]
VSKKPRSSTLGSTAGEKSAGVPPTCAPTGLLPRPLKLKKYFILPFALVPTSFLKVFVSAFDPLSSIKGKSNDCVYRAKGSNWIEGP